MSQCLNSSCRRGQKKIHQNDTFSRSYFAYFNLLECFEQLDKQPEMDFWIFDACSIH